MIVDKTEELNFSFVLLHQFVESTVRCLEVMSRERSAHSMSVGQLPETET